MAVALAAGLALAAGCGRGAGGGAGEGDSAAVEPGAAIQGASVEPVGSGGGEGMPRMLNADPPFRYPPALYAQKVQGNVVLRLFIDSTGRVWPESTLVTESSGFPALDTAAIQGSDVLRFKPAIKDGAPMNVRVAFPVYFRHPDARALPGDTVLKNRE